MVYFERVRVVVDFQYSVTHFSRIPIFPTIKYYTLKTSITSGSQDLILKATGSFVKFYEHCRSGYELVQYLTSVMDPNTLNLDPDPEFWPNVDPDPGLGYQF